jgi:hypothetical protein
LLKDIKAGRLPEKYHVVLDEAYPCTEQRCHCGRGGICLQKKMLLINICCSIGKLLSEHLGYWCNNGEFFGDHCECQCIVEEE